MRILVTGASGFVGRHLLTSLREAGHEPLLHGFPPPPPMPGETWFDTDLRDAAGLGELVRDQAPDACVHLAGMAFVPAADDDPAAAFQINTVGTLNLLTAFRDHAPRGRVLVVTSSQVYGLPRDDVPISEDHPLQPHNIYAMTKAAADQATRIFAERFDMPVMTARPHNHIGPGQSPNFVSSAFSRQLIAMGEGKAAPVIQVGNLDSERDFLDVRDVARAYRLLIEEGRPGNAYNIATGTRIPIRTMLDELCRLAGVFPERVVDPARFRPTDHAGILDTTRIREQVGWSPAIPLEQTLQDILDDVRTAMG